jgi:hypothetical protein
MDPTRAEITGAIFFFCDVLKLCTQAVGELYPSYARCFNYTDAGKYEIAAL